MLKQEHWPIIEYLKDRGILGDSEKAPLCTPGNHCWSLPSSISKESLVIGFSENFLSVYIRLYPSRSRDHDCCIIIKSGKRFGEKKGQISIELKRQNQDFKEIGDFMEQVIQEKIWDDPEIREETEQRVGRKPQFIRNVPVSFRWSKIIEIALEREPTLAVEMEHLPPHLAKKYGHLQDMAEVGVI